MKFKSCNTLIFSFYLLILFAAAGCKSSFYKEAGKDIAVGEAYNHSSEKEHGMTKWEYEQKLNRDQEKREEEQRQFNSMRNQ